MKNQTPTAYELWAAVYGAEWDAHLQAEAIRLAAPFNPADYPPTGHCVYPAADSRNLWTAAASQLPAVATRAEAAAA